MVTSVVPTPSAAPRVRTVSMSIFEWAAVNDNPRQRDTDARAKKALKNHLAKLEVTHTVVHAAELPNGRLFKLDGHTRGFLWATGRLSDPGQLAVVIYPASDLGEVKRLYDHFDSKDSVETSTDKIRGGMNEHGLVLKTPFLARGNIATALKLCQQIVGSSNWERHDMIGDWKRELELLDSISPPGGRFPSGVLAGALVALRKDDRAALEFFGRYSLDLGTKSGREMDAVEALWSQIKHRKSSKINDHVGDCGKTLAAYERYKSGGKFTSAVRGIDPFAYLSK